MSKQDLTQIKKDVDRISLHPVLKSESVRNQIFLSLLTFLGLSKKKKDTKGI